MTNATVTTMTKEELVEKVAEKLRQERGIPAQLRAAQAKVLASHQETYNNEYAFNSDFTKRSVAELERRIEDVIETSQKALAEVAAYKESENFSAGRLVQTTSSVFGTFNIHHALKGLTDIMDEIQKAKQKQESELRVLSQVLFPEEERIYSEAWAIVNSYNQELGICRGDVVKFSAVMTNRFRQSQDVFAEGVVSYFGEDYFSITVTEDVGKKAKSTSYDILYKHNLESIKYNLVELKVVERKSPSWVYLA